MFEDEYKKAYDKIKPAEDSIERIMMEAGKSGTKRRQLNKWKAASIAAAACLCVWSVFPVCAANLPAVYNIIESISPQMADFFVPIEKSSSSNGIVMQVEAVYLSGNQADVLVSFQDVAGDGRINGRVDLDSGYGLKSYSNTSNVGGSYFVKYDEEEKKAYIMLSLQAEEAFQKDKLTFYASSLMGQMVEEEHKLDLSKVEYEADLKSVTASGYSGIKDDPKYSELITGEKTESDPREALKVMDTDIKNTCEPDDFTITKIAYVDGILRVQICMGDNTHADRHVQLFLTDSKGNELQANASGSWHETVGDTRYQIYEYWFMGDFGKLEDCQMYGIFHSSQSYIEGDWRVTFRLE